MTLSFQDWRAMSAQQAADTFFAKLAEADPQARQAAIAWAAQADDLVGNFEKAKAGSGALAGIPYLLKDLFDVKGVPTKAGSSFYDDVTYPPTQDAAVVQKLAEKEAVLTAKTHLNEFAYGLSGINQWTGNCQHPHNPRTLAGGSSSGSAWGVARGLAPLGIGTDTGGSVRVPAAWCGLFGFRKAPCDWCMEGCVPLSPTLDSVGWMTANTSDMIETCHALLPALGKSTKKLRSVYIPDLTENSDPLVQEATQRLANSMGAEFDPETAAWIRHALSMAEPAYSILQSSEAYRVHEKWLDTMRDHYSREVWELIDRGRHWSVEQIKAAEQTTIQITGALEDYFSTFDMLLLPAVNTTAPAPEQATAVFKKDLLRLTAPASLARLPVLTLPIQLGTARSCGLQVIFPSLERSPIEEVIAHTGSFYSS